MNKVRNLLEARYPGLHGRIVRALVDAESAYNQRSGQAPSAFLLEHTLRTAAIAHTLSVMEAADPFIPSLVALYHDAGKFHEGEYHKDGIPEEEHAAGIAQAMLAEFGMPRGEIDTILEALRALYDDRRPCAGPCGIVQDADRLEKLGPLGIGAFFTKATLRGRGLADALVQTLSRELTYAVTAPRSMFTASGKALAQEQGAKTLAFFDDLLQDLERWGIAAFERRTLVVEGDFRTRRGARVQHMEVSIALPRACPDCGGPVGLSHACERGVKCDKLTVRLACRDCSYAGETYFCLPVLAGHDGSGAEAANCGNAGASRANRQGIDA